MAEYQKVRVCGSDLRRAFQNDLLSLADDLHAVELISDDNLAEIKNLNQTEPYRAGRLLEIIRNKVKLSATHYYTFRDVLKRDEQYSDILSILDSHPAEPSTSTGAPPIAMQQQQASGDHHRLGDRDYNEIYKKLEPHAHEWRKIGRELGFTSSEMDIIEHTTRLHFNAPKSYLEELLRKWLQWAPGDGRGSTGFATKESLIAALQRANLGALAESFENNVAAMTGVVEMPPESPTTATNKTTKQQGKRGKQVVTDEGGTGEKDTPSELPHETPEYDNDFVKNIKKPAGITRETEKMIRKLGFFEDDVVIILMVNIEEYRAACRYMKPIGRENILSLIKYTPSMTLGTFGGCNAVLVQTDMGAKCQENIRKALKEFPNAKAIILVGVAYGASRKKYSFGDVLVSSEINGFANARINEDGTVDARDPMLIHQSKFQKELLDAFTRDTDNWDSLMSTKEGRLAQVHTGPIASVPLLVDSVKARDSIVQRVSKMIGGEMEGCELLKIQHDLQNSREIGVIVVKGISDFADGDKDKRWQLTAAMAAASYVDKVISNNHRLFKPTRGQKIISIGFGVGIAIMFAVLAILIVLIYSGVQHYM